MFSQRFTMPNTAMGATLVEGGATFRVWAPRATAVHLCGQFDGVAQWDPVPANLMQADAHGYWTIFVPRAMDGDCYKFFIAGVGSSGYKRDPYARELTLDPAFPNCNCIVRDPQSYTWHDQAFVTPDYSNMIVYQLHVGAYAPHAPGAMGTFLDVVEKIDYLSALGANVVQLLPVDEAETEPTLGYNGTDYFSPDVGYVEYEVERVQAHLATINRILLCSGHPTRYGVENSELRSTACLRGLPGP